MMMMMMMMMIQNVSSSCHLCISPIYPSVFLPFFIFFFFLFSFFFSFLFFIFIFFIFFGTPIAIVHKYDHRCTIKCFVVLSSASLIYLVLHCTLKRFVAHSCALLTCSMPRLWSNDTILCQLNNWCYETTLYVFKTKKIFYLYLHIHKCNSVCLQIFLPIR